MSGEQPTVTVVVPARNEERDIEACLRSVLAQDWPRDRMEIIVVDGGSEDDTAGRAQAVLDRADVRGKVVENPVGATPSNLNVGLQLAGGDYLCRVDARSRLPASYVSRCVAVLEARPDVKVVGGAQVALARDETPTAQGIARALNNRYAMGLSRYRRGAASGPSDTVYLGFFRTEQVRAVGGWDEALPTNQDFDLNQRMGGRSSVWFEAGIDVGYIPRPDLRSLWKQYVRFGQWKVRYWRHTGTKPRPRQLVLLSVPGVALVSCVGWLCVAPRRVRAVLGVAPLVVLGAVDALGSRTSRAGIRTRVVAALAMLAVGGGWTVGVWRELARRDG